MLRGQLMEMVGCGGPKRRLARHRAPERRRLLYRRFNCDGCPHRNKVPRCRFIDNRACSQTIFAALLTKFSLNPDTGQFFSDTRLSQPLPRPDDRMAIWQGFARRLLHPENWLACPRTKRATPGK